MVKQSAVKPPSTFLTFGELLTHLRKRAHLTQDELGRVVGYSRAHVARLEHNQRLPSPATVSARFVPALDLGDVPELAQRLIELATTAHQPRTNLPAPLTSFIGREKEIAEIKHQLTTTRLLTLTGSGGTGKTRLALQTATEVLANYADGVWFIDLAPLTNPTFIPQTIADVFELREQPGRPALTLITDYLRAKHLLLILDNCEHLIDKCAALADQLLRVAARLTILATSREALGIIGEFIYHVPSLSLPTIYPAPDMLAQCEAVRLFIERAAAVTRFALTAANAPAVAHICQRLDGIPLAIELAAARVNVFAAEQIATRLNDRFQLLTAGSRTALPRQQTLRAMMDWSYDLLSESEQKMLRELSVFVGGWTFEAAEAICAVSDILGLLTRLVHKSLVIVEERDGQARYKLLETVREYACEKLSEFAEVADLRNRHLAYFVRLSIESTTAQGLIWLEQFEQELENFRAALTWGLEQQPESALAIAGNLMFFWVNSTHATESLVWLQNTVDKVKALPPAEHTNEQYRQQNMARALTAIGLATFSLGDWERANSVLTEAVSLAREAGDKLVLACAVSFQATALFVTRGQDASAITEEAVALARELGAVFLLPAGLIHLAGVARRQGDVARAERYSAEAQQLLQSGQVPIFIAPISNHMLAMEARLRGDFASATRYFQQGAILAQQARNPLVAASVASELAHLARLTGDIQAAKDAYRQSVLKWQDLGIRASVAHDLECFAYIARAESQSERAAQLLGAAEALREKIGISMRDEERDEYTREIAAVHDQLDDDRFMQVWAAGRALTMEQAIELALGP